MLKNSFVRFFICLALAAIAGLAQTQNLFVLPGDRSNATNVLVYSPQPFAPGTGFVAGTASYLVLAKPDGSKFYVVANSGSQTVTVVDNGFANPKSLGNLGQQAGNAAMAVDGSKLFVAAGTLQIFETTGDAVAANISMGPAVTVHDVAVSLDGTKVFTLGTVNAGGSQLNSVDLASNRVNGSLSIPGQATGIAVGPNGLIYVSTQNQVLEVDPTSLTVTPGGLIQLNAKPGRLVFTPDGKYGIAVNQTPITGSAVLFFDLSTRTLAGTIPNFNVTLDRLVVASSSTVYALSPPDSNAAMFQIAIGTGPSFVINPYIVPGQNQGPITSAVVSNEISGAGRTTAQYLFVVQNGTLFRVDLTTNATTGQFPLPTSDVGSALSYAGAAYTAGPVTTLLQYGNGQNITPNSVSRPLVVRALDANGHPLSGVTVNWSVGGSTSSVNPASSVTGTNGYAVTYFTAPPTSGVSTVAAAAGNITVAFTVGVGSTSGGAAGSLQIVAGQGQITFENFNTQNSGSPLTVLVTDVNGKPVQNTAVTFTVTQGSGTIIGGTQTGTPNSLSVNTDADGHASVNFLSSTIIGNGTGYDQSIISASASGTNSANFYITTMGHNPVTQQSLPPLVQLKKPNVGETIVGQAGTTLPGAVVVQVVSSLGTPIPNVSVIVGNGGLDLRQFPLATCNDPSGAGILTDANGVANCDLVFKGALGTISETASVGYFQTTPNFNIKVVAGPPAKVNIIQGNNQSGSPGQQLPLALLIQVTDASGNILSGIPVTWTVVNPGSVLLSGVVNVTDNNGRASALATLGSIAGNAQVKVTAGSVSATFTLTVNVPVGSLQKISGDSQTAVVNTQFAQPLVVKVVDNNGNGIAGLQVGFQITSGSGSVQTQSATTDGSGQASTRVTAGSTAGTLLVAATFSNFSVTFTLNTRLPGPQNVTLVNGASFQPGISPGSIAVLSGSGILTGVQGLYTSFQIVGPLPTSFPTPANVGTGSINFGGIPAPIYWVSNINGQEQVALQVPFEVQPGQVQMTINAVGGGTTTVPVTVQTLSPGVFETTVNNQKIAVAQRPDGSFVSPANPAQRGENIRIYVTGFGQVKPAAGTNTAGVPGQQVIAQVVAGLNNGGVPLVSAEYAQGLVGAYVITITVPIDTQAGPSQPLGLVAYDAANNQFFAQSTVIPIQ